MEEINNPTPNADGLNMDGEDNLDILSRINDQSVVKDALKHLDPTGLGPLPTIANSALRMEAETEKYARTKEFLDPQIERNEYALKKLGWKINQKFFGRVMDEVTQALVGNQPLEKQATMISEHTATMEKTLNEQVDRLAAIQATIENIKQNPGLLEKVVTRAQEDAIMIRRLALGVSIQDKLGAPSTGDNELDLAVVNQCIEAYKAGKFSIEPKHFQAAEEIYRNMIDLAQEMYKSGDPDLIREISESKIDPTSLVREGMQADIDQHLSD